MIRIYSIEYIDGSGRSSTSKHFKIYDDGADFACVQDFISQVGIDDLAVKVPFSENLTLVCKHGGAITKGDIYLARSGFSYYFYGREYNE